MVSKKRIKFFEGQWFAVPLRDNGYAIGVIARGNNKSVCLAYFFGPRHEFLPNDEETWKKKPEDAILISKFSDLEIVNGSWPIIQNTRQFSRDDWPIPKFGMEIVGSADRAYIREYKYDDKDEWILYREMVVGVNEIMNLPKDSFMGSGSVEIQLTRLLSDL